MAITLVIHGGAGQIKEADRPAYVNGLIAARDLGFERLEQGANAIEASLAAVVQMENNPRAFNAGTGASPNRDGIVECDAAVMAGHDGSAGAVAAVTAAQNPVLLAEKVRRESPHVLLVGAGADALATDKIDNRKLLTERSRQALKRWREKKQGPVGSATVGAVALDANGNLAAATSTGGVLGKWPGRVGDSPLLGAGTYANRQIAVSCTGKGEAFIRAVSAKDLACRLRAGESLVEAAKAVLEQIIAFDGSGGLIAITAQGQVCVGFNTPNMAYAWKSAGHEAAAIGLEPEIICF